MSSADHSGASGGRDSGSVDAGGEDAEVTDAGVGGAGVGAAGDAASHPPAGQKVLVTADATPGEAEAIVALNPDDPRAQIGLQSSGPVPPGVRADLVDEVLDRDELDPIEQVHVVMPLGDFESLEQLQKRTVNPTARAAGASSTIDADLPTAGDDLEDSQSI